MSVCDVCQKPFEMLQSRAKMRVDSRAQSLVVLERLLYTLDLDELVRNQTKDRLKRTCHNCINFMINDIKLEHRDSTENTGSKGIKKNTGDTVSKVFTIVSPTGPSSSEYKKIADLFHATVDKTIIRIEKNNNGPLYKRHLAITANAPANQIKYLFHGSQHDNYIKIMTNGFDITLSKDGSLGRGIYFADNASYSTSFTNHLQLNDTIVANMMVCRVYLRDDTKHGSDIHCVQHQDLGYPEYVVYYDLGLHHSV